MRDRATPFILLGGAPTTGKSSLARQLAKRLSLPWISTDQLRSVVKPYGEKSQFPYLFDTDGLSAEAFLNQYTAQKIAEMEFAQGEEVWPAVKALVSDTSNWIDGGIVEGVNILPHLVAQESAWREEKQVKAVFLIDTDRQRTRDVVYTRGLFDEAHTYSDDLKEKEVEWVLLFAEKLKSESEKHNMPCIELSKNESDIEKVLAALDIRS